MEPCLLAKSAHTKRKLKKKRKKKKHAKHTFRISSLTWNAATHVFMFWLNLLILFRALGTEQSVTVTTKITSGQPLTVDRCPIKKQQNCSQTH